MKYEIINPSDKCFITAHDERLAKIACAVLGQGWYGLRYQDGDTVMYPLQPLDEALGVGEDEIKEIIDRNRGALADVFSSFEYEDERTSLNDIGATATAYAKALRKEAQP